MSVCDTISWSDREQERKRISLSCWTSCGQASDLQPYQQHQCYCIVLYSSGNQLPFPDSFWIGCCSFGEMGNFCHQPDTKGVGNFWYSFDYRMPYFISLDGETDFAKSPEYPFARDATGNKTLRTEKQTYVTDSRPFGAVGNYSDTKTYEQYQWLVKDLESIDRCKTPWVIAMTHRPMYSSQVSSYQANIRNAFESILIENGVDVYLSGWALLLYFKYLLTFRRLLTFIGMNAPGLWLTIVPSTQPLSWTTTPTSLIPAFPWPVLLTLNITAFLDFQHYGFSKVHVINSTAATFSFVQGQDGSVRDAVTLLKKPTSTCSATSSASASVTYTTETVTSYMTYCPAPTVITQGSSTYTVTAATTLTITNCPCTLTYAVTSS